jgi:hypothetical protein
MKHKEDPTGETNEGPQTPSKKRSESTLELVDSSRF